ncbi:uncharacterized protein LOC115266957 [Aedes albopictus]|uniref:Secreted protein n=1 Tax=Aedes albopictus TaxID=7160 RepID=A0ABM1XJ67_AEDAL
MLGILLFIGFLSVGESNGQYTGQAYDPQSYYRKVSSNYNTGFTGWNSGQGTVSLGWRILEESLSVDSIATVLVILVIHSRHNPYAQIYTQRNGIPSDQWQQTARSTYYNPYYLQQLYGNSYSQQAQSGWTPYLSGSQGYYNSKDRSDGYGYEYPLQRQSYNLPYYQSQNYVGNPLYDGAGYGPRWFNDIGGFGGRRQDTRWYGGASRRNGLARTTPKPPKTTTTTTEAPTRKNVPRKSKLFVPNVWG